MIFFTQNSFWKKKNWQINNTAENVEILWHVLHVYKHKIKMGILIKTDLETHKNYVLMKLFIKLL